MTTTKKSQGTPLVAFRAGSLLPELQSRDEQIGQVAQRDLKRYYALLPEILKTVRLSQESLTILIDQDTSMQTQHEILKTLSDIQAIAVADAVERFWLLDQDSTVIDGLRRVGLIRD